MSSRSDNFNRSDTGSPHALGTPSDAGGNWSQHGTSEWGIVSNTAYNVGGGIDQSASLESSAADVEVEVTLTASPSSGGANGVCVRLTDGSNYYAAYWYIDDGNLYLDRYEAASYTNLGIYDTTMAPGDIIKVITSGTTIEVYLNDVLRITATSQTFNQSATRHGLYAYDSAAGRYDDFSITDSSGGGTTHTRSFTESLGVQDGTFQRVVPSLRNWLETAGIAEAITVLQLTTGLESRSFTDSLAIGDGIDEPVVTFNVQLTNSLAITDGPYQRLSGAARIYQDRSRVPEAFAVTQISPGADRSYSTSMAVAETISVGSVGPGINRVYTDRVGGLDGWMPGPRKLHTRLLRHKNPASF